MTHDRKLTGWHVLGMFVFGFGIIISVNLTLAYNAVRTFPGIEVKNSYVASQKFNENKAAQNALNWDVDAQIVDGFLNLSLRDPYGAVEAEIVNALFGRATHTGQDQNLIFKFDGEKFVAPVVVDAGNWNLRLVAMAPNGTVFQQRIVLRVKS